MFSTLKYLVPREQRETFLQPIIEDLKADFLEGIEKDPSLFGLVRLVFVLELQCLIQFFQIIGIRTVAWVTSAAYGVWRSFTS